MGWLGEIGERFRFVMATRSAYRTRKKDLSEEMLPQYMNGSRTDVAPLALPGFWWKDSAWAAARALGMKMHCSQSSNEGAWR